MVHDLVVIRLLSTRPSCLDHFSPVFPASFALLVNLLFRIRSQLYKYFTWLFDVVLTAITSFPRTRRDTRKQTQVVCSLGTGKRVGEGERFPMPPVDDTFPVFIISRSDTRSRHRKSFGDSRQPFLFIPPSPPRTPVISRWNSNLYVKLSARLWHGPNSSRNGPTTAATTIKGGRNRFIYLRQKKIYRSRPLSRRFELFTRKSRKKRTPIFFHLVPFVAGL